MLFLGAGRLVGWGRAAVSRQDGEGGACVQSCVSQKHRKARVRQWTGAASASAKSSFLPSLGVHMYVCD